MTERPRRLPEIVLTPELTKRPVNPGAEKWLGEPIPVLDHGFIYLVDYMGDDEAVAEGARVSYGRGTKRTSGTRGLIRHLMRHRHTSPYEMDEFKFHAKMPIFVARQWVRHRTASLNEYSGRYSILDNEFYIPESEVLAAQSTFNKQGRDEVLDPQQAQRIKGLLIDDALTAYSHYEWMLNDDGDGKPMDPERSMLARELARMGLTLNFYTQWYWKIDLHNLFHFISLRADKHAQYEIRVYAEAMSKILQDAVPLAWEAFVDYRLESINLSKQEKLALAQIFRTRQISLTADDLMGVSESVGLTNRREQEEFIEKFKALGILTD